MVDSASLMLIRLDLTVLEAVGRIGGVWQILSTSSGGAPVDAMKSMMCFGTDLTFEPALALPLALELPLPLPTYCTNRAEHLSVTVSCTVIDGSCSPFL